MWLQYWQVVWLGSVEVHYSADYGEYYDCGFLCMMQCNLVYRNHYFRGICCPPPFRVKEYKHFLLLWRGLLFCTQSVLFTVSLTILSRTISETNFAKDVSDAHKYTYKDKINDNTNNSSSSSKRYSNPITRLDRPWGFQEFEVPRFQDNWHMKVVRLSALRNGRLYPRGNIPSTHFC